MYVQGRRNVVKILRELIEKRRASSVLITHHNDGDMLDNLLRRDDDETKLEALNDDEIIDQIITTLYSGYETVSTTSMMAIKYLHDHQQALQQLRVNIYSHIFYFIFPIYNLKK